MPDYEQLFQRVAVAFAIGLLIGLERGWQTREEEEGQRVAGIRTFGLISLLGGLAVLPADRFGGIVPAFALAALAAVLIAAHFPWGRDHRDRGITTAVAALLTFVLGATAVSGYVAISVAAAVVSALFLGLKPQLHAWVSRIEEGELLGALKLLLISVVLLPVLPDEGYGPWEALNPYQIWWLVVLIATLGFVGYFAMKLAGLRSGALLTGFFGGLVSSTAVAFNFAHLGSGHARLQPILSAGIVIAAATMFPRILLIVAVIDTSLMIRLLPIFLGMTLAAAGTAAWLWHEGRREAGEPTRLDLPNPFELLPALQFGTLLVAIMLAAKAFAEWFGDRGAYALAFISGFADVDAIALSMARLSDAGLEPRTAANAIIVAAFTNTFAKGVLVYFVGGPAFGRRVGLALGSTLLVGGLLVWLLPHVR